MEDSRPGTRTAEAETGAGASSSSTAAATPAATVTSEIKEALKALVLDCLDHGLQLHHWHDLDYPILFATVMSLDLMNTFCYLVFCQISYLSYGYFLYMYFNFV